MHVELKFNELSAKYPSFKSSKGVSDDERKRLSFTR